MCGLDQVERSSSTSHDRQTPTLLSCSVGQVGLDQVERLPCTSEANYLGRGSEALHVTSVSNSRNVKHLSRRVIVARDGTLTGILRRWLSSAAIC